MTQLAISTQGLGKRYRVGQVDTAFARARRSMRGREKQEFAWALRDLSVEVKEGDTMAIVGRNGAGKSTLLKLLSRITEPTAGYADVWGRVGALLEVGTGFHGELTGRENVFLNGAILGMTRADVRRNFDRIVEFSGVAKYIDTPVKWYSTGMYMRLAFAVAAYLEPEILIVDEVLAVGDAEFQKRSLGRMGEVAKDGRTVLFVSHNMGAVRRLCEKAILLENGRLVEQGDTESVVARYLASVEDPEFGRRSWDNPDERPGDDFCRVVEVRVTDVEGRTSTSFFTSRPIMVALEFDLASLDSGFIAGFDLASAEGVTLFRSHHTDLAEADVPAIAPGRNAIRCTIPAGLLNSGRYTINLRLAIHRSRWIVHEDNVLSFDVIADHGDSFFLNDHLRPGLIAPVLNWELVEPTKVPGGFDSVERAPVSG